MSQDSIAPYATGRTSILVYKGKGILVKRCHTRDAAILDAIDEFRIKALPSQIYLTAFVGAQGQEVEISNSAFAFVKDTIPIHVHLREEDDSQERPRWPAGPVDVEPTDLFKLAKPINEVQTIRARAARPRPGAAEGSRTSESRMESISDWQRRTAETPDTAQEVHNSLPTGIGDMVQSRGEMLSDRALDSLVQNYVKEKGSLPVTLGEVSESSEEALAATPLSSNNAGKAWNWFKKTGLGLKSGAAHADKEPRALPVETLQTGLPLQEDRTNGARPRAVDVTAPAASQMDLSQMPPRPSKDDMQSHRHVTTRAPDAAKRTSEQVTEEIRTLLKQQNSIATVIQSESTALGIRADSLPDESSQTESWGPGGLVLDDGLSVQDGFSESDSNQNAPWWAKPQDAFDTRSRKKLGLKPLQLRQEAPEQPQDSKPSVPEAQGQHASRVSHARVPSQSKDTPQAPPIRKARRVSKNPVLTGGIRQKTRSREQNDANARPLPADLPESPYSSRRFTRHAERFDAPPEPPPLGIASTSNDLRVRGHAPTQPAVHASGFVLPAIQSHSTDPKAKTTTSRTPAPVVEAVPPAQIFPVPQRQVEDVAAPQPTPPPKKPRPKNQKQTTMEMKSAVPVAQVHSSAGGITASKVFASAPQVPHHPTTPPPFVPVAPEVAPPPRSQSSGKSGASSGAFAAAAKAARRQMTKDNRSTPVQALPSSLRGRQDSSNSQHAKQRSSLTSLRDYVAAPVPQDSQMYTQDELNEARDEIVSLAPSKISTAGYVGGSSTGKGRAASVMSTDSFLAQNMDTVNVRRLVLGPMDLSSPNRKGSHLIIKAKPDVSELSLEWQEERKTILTLPFDAIGMMQLPGPDCRQSFIIIKPMTGEIKLVLVELDEENLLAFQRYVLVFIAGLGADIEHISDSAFLQLASRNGW